MREKIAVFVGEVINRLNELLQGYSAYRKFVRQLMKVDVLNRFVNKRIQGRKFTYVEADNRSLSPSELDEDARLIFERITEEEES